MKTAHVQIRLTPAEKALLLRRARAAGQSLSAFVLDRALPRAGLAFEGILGALRRERDRVHALAALHDLLEGLGPDEFAEALPEPDLSTLPPVVRNQVAAMIEHAAAGKGIRPPSWTAGVAPLESPWFAAPLRGLRAHLLRSSPAAFRGRNLFVDAAAGDRA